MPNDGGLGGILAAGAAAAGTGSGSSGTSVTADPYGLGADGGIPIFMGDNPVNRTIPGQSNNRDSSFKPSYTDNVPVTSTASELASQFAAMWQTDPNAYAAIQQALSYGGYYGTSQPFAGGYTAKDQNALNDAMRAYYGYSQAITGTGGVPMTFKEFLARGGAASAANGGTGGGSGGGGGATRAPLQVQLTDPGQLKAQINAAAQEALGRDLDQGQIDAFVKAYQGKERAAQTNAYNGATEVTPPDASSMAMDAVKSGNQQEANNQSDGQFVRAFASMMGASF